MRLTISGEYPANWQAIAHDVRSAAGHRCVRCRHPFDAVGTPLSCDRVCDPKRGRTEYPLYARVPEASVGDGPHAWNVPGLNFGVHHFDGDKSNCRWWNLMPLCNSCHLSIQARVIPERQWLFDHSDWMKPYVGGFYAFWFAGRDEPRERVVALQRFFLAVGQPWLHPDQADAVRRYIAGTDGQPTGRFFGFLGEPELTP